MGPEALAQVLRPLTGLVPPERAASLVAGLDEGDDAAVYRLDDGNCLIFTVDFFTPVVDDPYDYGAIAAANALSDVYATGGRPLVALNISAFPADMDPEIMAGIVRGGAEKAAEGGCAVVGGHTITDKEPKFGMAVVGLARPDRVLLKSGAQPGDLLVLTKALGTGAVTTAAKNGACPSGFLGSAIKSMKRLNDRALDALAAHGVRACTDVTGFSFAGHALEIAKKSGVGLRVFAGSLPYLDGAAELAAAGHLPGGAGRNRRCFEPSVSYGGGLGEEFRKLFYVPETSGGLLGALPPGNAAACVRVLRDCGHDAAIVGAVAGPAAAPALELEAGAFRA